MNSISHLTVHKYIVMEMRIECNYPNQNRETTKHENETLCCSHFCFGWFLFPLVNWSRSGSPEFHECSTCAVNYWKRSSNCMQCATSVFWTNYQACELDSQSNFINKRVALHFPTAWNSRRIVAHDHVKPEIHSRCNKIIRHRMKANPFLPAQNCCFWFSSPPENNISRNHLFN